MFRPIRSVYSAIFVSFLLTGCTRAPQKGPLWSLSHADAANSGQILIASQPAQVSAQQTITIGPLAYSSPVISPDGTVYIATFNATPGTAGNELLALSIKQPLSIKHRWPLGGQISTPAVDKAGNVYVAQYFDDVQQSRLISLNSDGQTRFSFLITGQSRALSAPKVFDTPAGTLVFQTYIGGITVGGHILVVDSEGKNSYDQLSCENVTGGIGLPKFQVPPVQLGPPYPEDPAVGLRNVQTPAGPVTYAVSASDSCGLTFYELHIGGTLPLNARSFQTISYKTSSAAYFGSPAITLGGIAVISDSNQKVTAYDCATGKQKWQYKTAAFLSTTPAFIPLGQSVAYVASYDRLTKLDIESGQSLGEIGLIGPVDAAPVIAGNNIFVSTYSGLFTYNLNLQLLAFAPFNGGRSTPGIGPAGQIMAASADGSFFVFGTA